MKKFELKKEIKTLFEGFEFELNGKEYQKKVIDQELFDALSELENIDNTDKIVKALIGEEQFEENKPFNVLEVMALSKWIFEEFVKKFLKIEMGIDLDKKKEEVEKITSDLAENKKPNVTILERKEVSKEKNV
jgi:hypothetical protein